MQHMSRTVLSVATRNIPGSEIPAPLPIVMPSKMATWKRGWLNDNYKNVNKMIAVTI